MKIKKLWISIRILINL